jgi:hypothetical protein
MLRLVRQAPAWDAPGTTHLCGSHSFQRDRDFEREHGSAVRGLSTSIVLHVSVVRRPERVRAYNATERARIYRARIIP